MTLSNPEMAIMSMAIITTVVFTFGIGVNIGKNKTNEEWKQRTQQAGFNLVTRYDQLTGEAKLILIPTNGSGVAK